jgi:hypothetical protein
MKPRRAAEVIEGDAPLPDGLGDGFSGYGVMGLTFASGHVLALRRFPASSIGPGYASVWHRDPTGRWTVYSTVAPHLGCARYFGGEIARNVVMPIAIEWLDDARLYVMVGEEIRWEIDVRASWATGLMNLGARLVPERLWLIPQVVQVLAGVTGWALRAGTVKLVGHTPNGHRFLASPRRLWLVASSRAVVGGVDLGAVAPLPVQAALGDFRIPRRGVFAVASVRFWRPVAATTRRAAWSRTQAAPPCLGKENRP